jgi:hypothetical protein
MHTRRDFGKIALSTVAGRSIGEPPRRRTHHSTVAGVKLGAISYCFRAMPAPRAPTIWIPS